jgi:hypothetical protein
MSINTTLAGLSTNPALNGPDGATDVPSALDDQQRYHGSFIAQLRDGTGFTAGAVVASLGFTPVQQGTGASQLTNVVKIGWSASTQLRLQIDATDYGVNWPINITGNAATATNATTAATATNANALGGVAPAGYVKSNPGNVLGLVWDSSNGWVYPTVDGTSQSSYTLWEKIPNRPTDLGQFTNGPGYQTAAQLIAYAVQREVSVKGLGNIGLTGAYVRLNDNSTLSWGTTVSDARLKENIRPTEQDSLAKVRRLSFKAFNFKEGCDDGHEHKSGLIAQDLEAIDPELVDNAGTWKQPREWEMLCVALHSIQQLEARVAELEASK